MKHWSYGFMGLLLIALPALSPLSARAESGDITFSEINWAGSSKSTADEWLELANLGQTSVDLSGWKIEGAATASQALPLPSGTIIGPHETLLIANYDVGASSTLSSKPQVVTTAVALANSNLKLALVDPSGAVHDSLDDTGAPDFGGTTPSASMERDLVTKVWQTSTTSTGLTATTQLGTPGSAVWPIEEVVVTPPTITTEPDPITPEIVIDPVTPPPDTVQPTTDTTAPTADVTAPSETTVPIDTTPAVPAVEIPTPPDPVAPAVTETSTSEPVITEPVAVSTAPVENPSDSTVVVTPPTIVDEPISSTATVEATVTPSEPSGTPGETTPVGEAVTTADAAPEVVPIEPSDLLCNLLLPEGGGEPPAAAPSACNTEAPSASAAQTPITTPQTNVTAVVEDPQSTHAPTPSAIGELLITELVASPTEGDEWVEITNVSTQSLDITGTIIKDGSGKTTPLPSKTLAPGEAIVLSPIAGNLNNDGDSLSILSPSGLLIDSLKYGTGALEVPKKGQALIRYNDLWFTSTAMTPGAANNAPTISYESPSQTQSNSSNSAQTDTAAVTESVGSSIQTPTGGNSLPAPSGETANPPQGNVVNTTPKPVDTSPSPIKPKTTTAKATTKKPTVAKAVVVKVAATVKAATSKTTTAKKTKSAVSATTYQTVSIADLDKLASKTKVEVRGTVIAVPGSINATTLYLDGLEVSVPAKNNLPKLDVGQTVTLRGALVKSADGLHVSLHAAQPFVVNDDAIPIAAQSYSASAPSGRFVVITGDVTERNGNTLLVHTSEGDVLVRAPKSLTNDLPTSKANLTVTGVLHVASGTREILLRGKEDLVINNSAALAAPLQSEQPWVRFGLLTGSIGILGTWVTSGRKILSLLH